MVVAERMGSRSPPAKYIHSKTEEKKSRPGTAGQKARVKMSQEVVRNIVSPPQKRKRNASFEPKSASVV